MAEYISPIKRRWSISFIASMGCHVLLAVLITWQHVNKPIPKHQPPKNMDVVLLNPEKSKSIKAPEKADAIANRNAEGANSKAEDRFTRSAKSPIPGQQQRPLKPAVPQQPRTPPPQPTPKPEQKTRTLAKRGPMLEPPEPVKKKPPQKQHKKPPAPPPIPLSNLLPSSMAMAELSRDFARERRLKKMLAREADIPINTREAKYAPYAHQLVRALEEQWRPGQANYQNHPEDERRALMRLTIEKDGSLGAIQILRPSPIEPLNDSAVAAIHAAAPFRPLPSVLGLDRVSFYLTFEVLDGRFVFRPM
ncbi:MAG: TonB C-terminal domain-containing protein [Mariprofundaceae bacterium]